MDLLGNLTNTITIFMDTLKVLVGGVFGLYLIIILLKWREYKILKATVIGLREDVRFIAKKQGIKFENLLPEEKPSLLRRIDDKLSIKHQVTKTKIKKKKVKKINNKKRKLKK